MAFAAVPHRHPDHDDPEKENTMAASSLALRHEHASTETSPPRPGTDGRIDGGPPVLLALDLGSCTGWALRGRDGTIASGTIEFRPGRFEGAGMAFLRFKGWLEELHDGSGPIGAVLFEEVRRHAGTTAAHVYGGFLAHLAAWCEHRKVPYRGVPVGTIKRHIAGKGNARKDDVIAAVRALGFSPADDNEADALALLHWAFANGFGGSGATVAPLATRKRGGPR